MTGLIRFLTCWCGASSQLNRSPEQESVYICEEDSSHRTRGEVSECSAGDPELSAPVGV